MDGLDLPEFTDIFDRKYQIDDDVDTMIEKCVILTHIYSRDFQLYL